ncbi:MAG TPA: sulfite exporter TauE/SafE family protein [Hyphomicrobiaceae bacterium]|nr:sulfite exporter TauE/SafE family protein [Hyphomicrobiaceae bacterium]
MIWAAILVIGIAAGTLGGIVGFGASVMLMPILVLGFGAKEAVQIMAIAGIIANVSRVVVWWRDVDVRLNVVYCATALPAAYFGARTLLALDTRMVETILGVFFIVMIPVRRWLLAKGFKVGLPHLAVVGAGIGFLTGIVASTGPLNTPFFLAYGLTKGAFLGTEALGSALIGITKAITFRSFGSLPVETISKGCAVGASLWIGSWIAKRLVERMDASQFRFVIDAMMALAGLTLLYGALTAA